MKYLQVLLPFAFLCAIPSSLQTRDNKNVSHQDEIKSKLNAILSRSKATAPYDTIKYPRNRASTSSSSNSDPPAPPPLSTLPTRSRESSEYSEPIDAKPSVVPIPPALPTNLLFSAAPEGLKEPQKTSNKRPPPVPLRTVSNEAPPLPPKTLERKTPNTVYKKPAMPEPGTNGTPLVAPRTPQSLKKPPPVAPRTPESSRSPPPRPPKSAKSTLETPVKYTRKAPPLPSSPPPLPKSSPPPLPKSVPPPLPKSVPPPLPKSSPSPFPKSSPPSYTASSPLFVPNHHKESSSVVASGSKTPPGRVPYYMASDIEFDRPMSTSNKVTTMDQFLPRAQMRRSPLTPVLGRANYTPSRAALVRKLSVDNLLNNQKKVPVLKKLMNYFSSDKSTASDNSDFDDISMSDFEYSDDFVVPSDNMISFPFSDSEARGQIAKRVQAKYKQLHSILKPKAVGFQNVTEFLAKSFIGVEESFKDSELMLLNDNRVFSYLKASTELINVFKLTGAKRVKSIFSSWVIMGPKIHFGRLRFVPETSHQKSEEVLEKNFGDIFLITPNVVPGDEQLFSKMEKNTSDAKAYRDKWVFIIDFDYGVLEVEFDNVKICQINFDPILRQYVLADRKNDSLHFTDLPRNENPCYRCRYSESINGMTSFARIILENTARNIPDAINRLRTAEKKLDLEEENQKKFSNFKKWARILTLIPEANDMNAVKEFISSDILFNAFFVDLEKKRILVSLTDFKSRQSLFIFTRLPFGVPFPKNLLNQPIILNYGMAYIRCYRHHCYLLISDEAYGIKQSEEEIRNEIKAELNKRRESRLFIP